MQAQGRSSRNDVVAVLGETFPPVRTWPHVRISHTYKGNHGQPGVLDLLCLELLQTHSAVSFFEDHATGALCCMC